MPSLASADAARFCPFVRTIVSHMFLFLFAAAEEGVGGII